MCQLSHFASRAYAKRKRIERRHFNAGQQLASFMEVNAVSKHEPSAAPG